MKWQCIIVIIIILLLPEIILADGSYSLRIQSLGNDFNITGFADGKFLGYVSPVSNKGRWTDIRGYGNPDTQNILDGGGGFYDHPVLWWGGSSWDDGTCYSYTIDQSIGKIVSWHGKWRNASKGFDSEIISQKIAVNTTGMIIVRSDIKITFTQPSNNLNGLWVEFGWHMNDYSTTAIVRRSGYSSTSVVSITPMNMASQPASHYFDGQLLYTANGDYICGYGGTTYNVAVAYVPLGWDNGGTSYCRAWDTNGSIDQTDTMELHYYNPVNWSTYKSVTTGEVHRFSYYLVVSANGQKGYNWVPAISELVGTTVPVELSAFYFGKDD
ncbi:MAG: hypothetical protein ACE14V_03165 [bacterium]